MNIFKIVPVLVLLSLLGACATSNNGNYRYEPTSKSGDIESKRAERLGEKKCGRMPAYTNSGKSYVCDPEIRRWVPEEHAGKSEEEKQFVVELERCIERYKRNGYRGSPTLSCGQQLQRRYRNRNHYDSEKKDDRIALYKTKLVLVGYANCKAEILDVRGVPRRKYQGQNLEFGYKNRNLKVTTNIKSDGQFHSRYHYFIAHEQTQFLLKLILPNGQQIGPIWSDWFQYDENTDLEDLTYVHAARDFAGSDAEVIRSGCLLN